MRNLKIAAAVAAVIAACGAASAAYAGSTTAAVANAAAYKFYTGGSSAAVSGLSTGVGADLCGGVANVTVFTSNPSGSPTRTPDFRAFSCVAAKPAGAPWVGQQITVYYRAEGGSVVGAYAPLNNLSVNQLNLGTAACGAPVVQTDTSFISSCTVGGFSDVNGPTDSYTSGVSPHVLEYGISDLEPGVFGNSFGEPWAGGGNDDPTSVYPFLGADATPDQLQGMTHTLLFQQTFGLVANKGLGITDMPRQVAAAIFNGTLSNWQDVAINGVQVKAASTPIHVCHRDLGSGTRTSTDIFFEQTGCNTVGGTAGLADAGTNPDNFSTGDVLACVDGDAASIGYVSVDNFSKVKTNTTALTLDGQTASNKAAAQGDYGWAYEASANKNTNITFTANQNTFWNYFIPAIQTLATAPQSAQINVLPGVTTNKSNNHTNGVLQVNGKVYVSSYARDTTGAGNSCTPLQLH
jgi:hypothetical protein